MPEQKEQAHPDTIEQPKFAVLLQININGHVSKEIFITQTADEVPPQVNEFVQAFTSKQDVIWIPNPSLRNGYRISHVSSYHISRLDVETKAEGTP